jgi:hypothetical protein
MTHNRPDIPYYLPFQHCVVEAAHRADRLPSSEKVDFIFDRQEQFGEHAVEIFNAMSIQNTPSISAHFLSDTLTTELDPEFGGVSNPDTRPTHVESLHGRETVTAGKLTEKRASLSPAFERRSCYRLPDSIGHRSPTSGL